MNNIVEEAIKWITYNTKFTPYQTCRVIELCAKYGEKTKYHLTKKQLEIYNILMYLFGV